MNRKLRLLSLCAGIGAIDYVWLYILGQEIAGQVEIDPYCQAILARHFPDVPKRGDIREVRGDEFGTIDLVAGGVPCQPFSLSGKRRGTADDRYLWPEALRIVRCCQPRWTLIENVAGFISLALDVVYADLESAGYTCRAVVLPACAVGAPHFRERVFIVAHATGRGCQIEPNAAGRTMQLDASGTVADATQFGQRTWRPQQQRPAGAVQPDGAGASDGMADAARQQNRRLQQQRVSSNLDASSTNVADSNGHRRGQRAGQPQREFGGAGPSNAGAAHPQGKLADAEIVGLSQWETFGTDLAAQREAAQRSGDTKQLSLVGQAQPRMGRVADGLADWVDGTRWPAPPGEPQHEWEPPRTIVERDRDRARRLKALGNAIVPQQIAPILHAIVEIERAGEDEQATTAFDPGDRDAGGDHSPHG